MKTLFQRVFDGNDAMYALAVKAVDEAIAKLGADAPATFGDTAYSLLRDITLPTVEAVERARTRAGLRFPGDP